MSATWMTERPVVNKLPNDRLQLRHGPINIVLKAWADPETQRKAQRLIFRNFPKILPELVNDLPTLRKPATAKPVKLGSPTAQRMSDAASRFAAEKGTFITPMAAVAGAVAEEVLRMLETAGPIERAFVNNGGDIAVLIAAGQTLRCGVAGDFSAGSAQQPVINGAFSLASTDGIGGIATSGAQGKSFSLGIADSVTVLAETAAMADCAATLIANAVNIDSAKIKRSPANKLDPDTDLGNKLVTTAVGKLDSAEIAAALDAGQRLAEHYVAAGLIRGALLQLRGEHRAAGPVAMPLMAA